MVFNSLFSKQKLFPHRFHQRCVCSLSYVQREWLIVIATTELYNKQVESLVRNNNKHLFLLRSPWFGVSADLGWTGPISTVSVVSCKSAGLPRIVSAGSSALWTTWSHPSASAASFPRISMRKCAVLRHRFGTGTRSLILEAKACTFWRKELQSHRAKDVDIGQSKELGVLL